MSTSTRSQRSGDAPRQKAGTGELALTGAGRFLGRLRRPVVILLAVLLAASLSAVTPGPADAAVKRCGGKRVTIVGTSGNDRLTGTSGPDVISGLGGNDVITGLGGNDTICGGRGKDRIIGGSGNDRIFGNSGRDRLSGSSGNDRLAGGSGRDVLKGGSGDDRLFGGKGNDLLKGGRGDDQLIGGKGRDRLRGQSGIDRCGTRDFAPGVLRTRADEDRSCEVAPIAVRDQTVTFGGSTWKIMNAVSSYESKSTFGRTDRTPRLTDQRRIYLDLQIFNGLSQTQSFRDTSLLLRLPGAPVVIAENVTASTAVGAGTTADRRIAFPVPDGVDVSKAVLVLGSSAVEQESLPIGSAAPAPSFPRTATVDRTARLARMNLCEGNTVQLLSGQWDIELGDNRPGGLNGSREWSYRAAAGTRFLIVEARFVGACRNGENLFSRAMRVEIDGVPRQVWTRHNTIVSEGEARDQTLGFVVPADARVVTLLFGRFGAGQIAEFEIQVPDLSR